MIFCKPYIYFLLLFKADITGSGSGSGNATGVFVQGRIIISYSKYIIMHELYFWLCLNKNSLRDWD